MLEDFYISRISEEQNGLYSGISKIFLSVILQYHSPLVNLSPNFFSQYCQLFLHSYAGIQSIKEKKSCDSSYDNFYIENWYFKEY